MEKGARCDVEGIPSRPIALPRRRYRAHRPRVSPLRVLLLPLCSNASIPYAAPWAFSWESCGGEAGCYSVNTVTIFNFHLPWHITCADAAPTSPTAADMTGMVFYINVTPPYKYIMHVNFLIP